MSISANVGGMSSYLNKIRTADSYLDLKVGIYNALRGRAKGDSMIEKEAVAPALLPLWKAAHTMVFAQ